MSIIPNISSMKYDRLPILTGSENYRRWAGSWEIAFDAMGLLDYLNGNISEPLDKISKEWKTWNTANKQLRGALLNAVDESLQTVVIDSPTAKEAWEQFKARYDRETASSTISLLKGITNISFQDGEKTQDFITRFNDAWNRLRARSLTAKTSLAKVFQDLTSSEDAKGAFLLNSLPPNFENVIDNLITKELISYHDVSAKLLDMSENRQNKTADDKAYNATRPDEKECSFCKARKYRYKGHLFTDCKKLKAHKQKKKEKQSNAKIAQESGSKAKSIDDEIVDTAFVVDNFSSSYWIFDTGASAHMTGCHSDFHTFTPLSGQNVKIADNTLVPVTGKRTVKLNFRNRKQETFSTLLQDVLLVPTFGKTRLFSWNAVSKKGFKMFGEGEDIILKNKSGQEVLWAKAGRKAHIIQIDIENANFSSYYDFHMALGHPGLSTVKNPSKLYDTNLNLPSPPPNFHCSTCEMSKSKHTTPPKSHGNTNKPFELIHSDLSGKFSVPSLVGK